MALPGNNAQKVLELWSTGVLVRRIIRNTPKHRKPTFEILNYKHQIICDLLFGI
jgi:hypothetical protein